MNAIKMISRWLDYKYSSSLMFILFIVVFGFFWLFNLSSFPISNPELLKISGQEGLLDTQFFYSAHEAYTAMTHYGEEGRNVYQNFIAADFIFIIFYSFAFAFLMTVTVRSVCGRGSSWSMLNLLPLIIGFWDYVENICVFGLLNIYPTNNAALGTISGFATVSKWLLTVVTISLILYGGIILLLRYFGLKQCAIQH